MDEYASSAEENESPVGDVGTSYLDDDEVQIRESDGTFEERSRSQAIDYEEEVVRLRSSYRGIWFIIFFRNLGFRAKFWLIFLG